MLSDRNGIKLETSNRKITGKSPNAQELDNTLLNNPQFREEDSNKNLSIHRTGLK